MDGGSLAEVGRKVGDLSDFVSLEGSSDIEKLTEKVTILIKSLEGLHSAHVRVNPELRDRLYQLSDTISHSVTSQTEEKVKGIVLGLLQGIELVSHLEIPNKRFPVVIEEIKSAISLGKLEEAKDVIEKMTNSPLKIQAFMEYPISLEEGMAKLVDYIENQDLESCRKLLELIKEYVSTSPNKGVLEEKVTVILARKEFGVLRPDFQKVLDLVKEIKNWEDKKPFLVTLVKKGITSGLFCIIKNLSEEQINSFYNATSGWKSLFQKTDAQKFLENNKPAILLIKELDLPVLDLQEIVEAIKELKSPEGKNHVLIALINKGFIPAAEDLIKDLSDEEFIDFYHFISQSKTEFASVELYDHLRDIVERIANTLEQKVLDNMSSQRVSYVRGLTYEGTPSHVENPHDFLEEALALKGFREDDLSEDALKKCIARYVGTMGQDLKRNYSYNICGYRINKDIIKRKMGEGGQLDLSLGLNRDSIKERLISLREDYRLQSSGELVQKAIDSLESSDSIEISDDLVVAVCLIEVWEQIDAMPGIDLRKMCGLVSLLQQGIVGAVSQDFAKIGYEVDNKKFTLAEISVGLDFRVKSTLTTSLISSYLLHPKIDEPLLEPFFTEEERENKEFIAGYRREVSRVGEFRLNFICDLLGGNLSVEVIPLKANPIYNTWNSESILKQGYIDEYASLYEENRNFLTEVVLESLDESLSLQESKKAVKDLALEIVVARDAAIAELQKQFNLGIDDEHVDLFLEKISNLYRSTNRGVNRLQPNLDDYIPCYLLNIASKTVAEKKEILQKAIEDFPAYHKLLQKYKSVCLDHDIKIPPLKLDKIEEISSAIARKSKEMEVWFKN